MVLASLQTNLHMGSSSMQHNLHKHAGTPTRTPTATYIQKRAIWAMASAQTAQDCFEAVCTLVLKDTPAVQPDSGISPKPVVYSTSYNISFGGLEHLHPFDPCKYSKVMRSLRKQDLVDEVWEPCEVPAETLAAVHSKEYLARLHSSSRAVARVVELPPLAILPMCLTDRFLLRKLRIQAAGTILAAGLAVREGWAVNIGGGMHHASWDKGEGWCAYSDITMAIQQVRAASRGAVDSAWVIDTDAHPGNGYARDKLRAQDARTTIIDLYNSDVFPADAKARPAINVERRLHCGCASDSYLEALRSALDEADECGGVPDLVIHNAGTDILDQDPLGRMCVSAEAVQQRDMMVWARFRERHVPVCMLLSGGYAQQSAAVIAASLAGILKWEAQAR